MPDTTSAYRAKEVDDGDYAEVIAKVFAYLDKLRASGVTNMFGASPYIKRDFGMPRDEADAMLKAWMRTFCDDPADVRARAALEAARAADKADV